MDRIRYLKIFLIFKGLNKLDIIYVNLDFLKVFYQLFIFPRFSRNDCHNNYCYSKIAVIQIRCYQMVGSDPKVDRGTPISNIQFYQSPQI